MGVKLKSILVTLALVMFSTTVFAQSLVQRHSPRMMQGTRPLGMGGAFIAVQGTDENAMFYNPAAINDYETKPKFYFLLPTAEFSAKSINFFSSDIPDLADDIDAAATDGGKIGAFNTFANNNTGRYEEVALRGSVAIMMHKYITASLFYESQGVAALLNPASSTVDIEAVTQGGLMVGSAYSFFDDHLQVGAAVKFIERHLIDQTVTQRDVITNNDFGDIFNLSEFGFGIGFDLGIKGKLPVNGKLWDKLKPQFALVIQDIGDTRFFAGNAVGRQQQSTSIGMALHPEWNWGKHKFKAAYALDMRDLEYRQDFFYKFRTGLEVQWVEISKVLRTISARVGLNQAYVTGGLGFDFRYFKLNLATFGRSLGTKKIQKESRMFSFQLAAGF